MKGINEIMQEQNIFLATTDPVAKGGFTQVPNFILKDGCLSLGAKVTYAMFLSYAWQKDSCFPGQERLAEDMGMSRSRVTFARTLAGAIEYMRASPFTSGVCGNFIDFTRRPSTRTCCGAGWS